MKNVTVTLDEDLAAWARVEAARQGKSLSRYLSDVLKEQRSPRRKTSETLEAFLSGPGWPSDGGPLPSREDLYEDRFRRYEHPDLRTGSGLSGKGGEGQGLDRGPGTPK